MGLYLFNISVDTTDPNPEYISEDLSINDQESLVEILVEKVLGFENAIVEYDDHDTEERTKKKNTKIDFFVQYSIQRAHPNKTFDIRKQRYPNHEDHLTKGYYRLTIPPPKI